MKFPYKKNLHTLIWHNIYNSVRVNMSLKSKIEDRTRPTPSRDSDDDNKIQTATAA